MNKEMCYPPEERFRILMKSFRQDPQIVRMEEFIQHGTTTTLEHCENVARVCFLLNHKLGLKVDERKLLNAAMLHDYYLYDWHDGEPCRKTHGFDHPDIACANAVRDFRITREEQEAILSHMWPLTITRIPRSRLALLLCLSDKYCALLETLQRGAAE